MLGTILEIIGKKHNLNLSFILQWHDQRLSFSQKFSNRNSDYKLKKMWNQVHKMEQRKLEDGHLERELCQQEADRGGKETADVELCQQGLESGRETSVAMELSLTQLQAAIRNMRRVNREEMTLLMLVKQWVGL